MEAVVEAAFPEATITVRPAVLRDPSVARRVTVKRKTYLVAGWIDIGLDLVCM